jgi:hypothetical protein
MTNKKIALFAIPVLAAILIGGTIAPTYAGGVIVCDNDKNTPLTGDQGGDDIVSVAGKDCYIENATNINSIILSGAGQVNIEFADVSGNILITGSTDKVKIKDSTGIIIFASENTGSHVEVMDNTTSGVIFVDTNSVAVFKVSGNTALDIDMLSNDVEKIAFCKNNSPDATGGSNTYNGVNNGCP